MKNFIAGKIENQGYYSCFTPNPINREWVVDDMRLITLLSKADRILGRLDMFSNYVPNIDLFISMHVLKEATKSSNIEGTQTNIEEALMQQYGTTSPDPYLYDNLMGVINRIIDLSDRGEKAALKAGNSDMAENYRKDARMCRNAKNQLIMQH